MISGRGLTRLQLLAIVAWLAMACADPLDPSEQERLLGEGDEAIQDGEVARAEALYERVVRSAPGNARAVFGLGLARLRSGYTAAALESFDRAVELDPGNADYAYLRAHTLAAQEREAEAIAAFQALLENHREHARATAELAALLVGAGRHDEAYKTVLAGLEASPDSYDLLLLAGQVLAWTGAHEESISYYEQARLTRPHKLEPIYGLIEAHRRLDRLDESRVLMMQFEELRRRQEALDELKREAEELPTDPGPAELYARRLLEEGHLEEAVQQTGRFLSSFPSEEAGGALAIRAAQASALLGDDVQTRALLERALATGSRSFEELFTAAELRARLGDLKEASVAYERCLQLRPDDAAALLGLGKAALGLGDMSQAAVYLRRAVEEAPEDAAALAAFGMVLSKTDDVTSARGILEKALAIDPGQPEALFGLALLLRAEGRSEAAEAHLRLALQRRPDHAAIRAMHAIVLADLERCEEAIPALELGLGADSRNMELHSSLVTCLEKTGKTAEADEARRNASQILGQAP